MPHLILSISNVQNGGKSHSPRVNATLDSSGAPYAFISPIVPLACTIGTTAAPHGRSLGGLEGVRGEGAPGSRDACTPWHSAANRRSGAGHWHVWTVKQRASP